MGKQKQFDGAARAAKYPLHLAASIQSTNQESAATVLGKRKNDVQTNNSNKEPNVASRDGFQLLSQLRGSTPSKEDAESIGPLGKYAQGIEAPIQLERKIGTAGLGFQSDAVESSEQYLVRNRDNNSIVVDKAAVHRLTLRRLEER